VGRYERRVYFEHLCELRAAYQARGPLDRGGPVTIEEAIEFCELIMSQMPETFDFAEPAGPTLSEGFDRA
jgi:hypothetical protein